VRAGGKDAARAVAEAAKGAPLSELPQLVCAAAHQGLHASGVTLSLLTDTPARQLLAASNAVALRLEEIQFTMAEGPCIDAAATDGPVVVEGLPERVTPWPLFGTALQEQLPEVTAVYAFPLRFGDYVLGSMDVLTLRRGEGQPEAPAITVGEGQRVADAVSAALAPSYARLLGAGEPPSWEPEDIIRKHWFATHRAVGVLAARLDVPTEDAWALMRADAFRSGRTLVEITEAILNGHHPTG
jgi:hypothetical protein